MKMKTIFWMSQNACRAMFMLAIGAGIASAQPVNPPASFTLIGHIEKFTLDTPGNVNSAAKVTVRGIEVVLPANLILTLTGGYLTAEQMFRGRNFKTPSVPPRTGLALTEMTDADMVCPPPLAAPGKKCPLPAGEIELAGNIVNVAGVQRYVAGTARISQGALHLGSGFIRSMDPVTGFFTVGIDSGAGATSRMRLNDPEGIYGPKPDPTKPLLLDMRFALDPGNSPVHAHTGFPVCLPDSARPALCPASNRAADPTAANYRSFTCGPSPTGVNQPILPGCEPRLPVPLKIGDYINYVGMLDKDDVGYFVSLHGLEAELGIYTSPGLDPAYVFVEEALQGTLGARWPLDATTTIPQEATSVFKLVGFTSDPNRTISVEIFDDDANSNPLNPTFAPTRLATKIVPTNLAQLGRFKMIWSAKEDARVVRRNVRVKLSGASIGPFNPQLAPGTFSNEMTGPLLPAGASLRGGYAFGQYEAPISEYISPETTLFGVKGWPVPVNFEDFCFLKTTNTVGTQEPDATNGYVSVVVGPVVPSPAARPLSQLLANGVTRVCGD
jgi:hypothetical protein